MTELLTAAQMRAIEQAAIASGEVKGLELMERAGRGVVEAIFEEWPELKATSHRAVVLCGPGNNGGDGFVVARLLKEWGWEVEVFLYGDPERLPPDARVNYERWRGMGKVQRISPEDDVPTVHAAVDSIWETDVFVDAMFGTGLTRAVPYLESVGYLLHKCFRDALWWYGNMGEPRVVAIDVPSGLCADSGKELCDEDGNVLREPYAAYLTVTFHSEKVGHFLRDGPKLCTKMRLVDIGLSRTASAAVVRSSWVSSSVKLVQAPEVLALLATETSIVKRSIDHKYVHGHALILSGPPGHTGAARLAARGALRIGAGLVTIGCPPEAIPEHAAQVTAVMLRAVADGAALAEALDDKRINALCLGPALGLDDRARGLVAAALGRVGNLPTSGAARGQIAHPTDRVVPSPPSPPHEGEGGREASSDRTGANGTGEALPLPLVGRGEGRGALRPTVLDADALTLLSQDPDLFAQLHDKCVLTPHAGEFARLFPDIAEKLAAPATKGPAYSKVDATREAAARAGCVVLYKGPDTVIADPSGRCSINSAHYDRAAPWLATAGSGDVLAGFITGLLARGFAPMQAAETAAWLHVECARKFGPGLIAEDLAEQLPAVFRDLGL